MRWWCQFALLLFAIPALAQTLRINCGGPAVVDGSTLWQADTYYSSGVPWTAPSPAPGSPAFYNTVRYGNFVYTLPVSPGEYTVTLRFMENSTAISGPGQRKFNVNLNGVDVLRDFDIAAEAGLFRVLDRSFPVTVTSTGGIRVQFTTVVRNAIVNAIEVVQKPVPAKNRVLGALLSWDAAKLGYPLPAEASLSNVECYVNGLHYWPVEDYTIVSRVITPVAGAANWPAPADAQVRVNYDPQ